MPDINTIAEWLENARSAPKRVWRDYAFDSVPFAVYDADAVVYVNHPSPPAERPQSLMAATALDVGGVKTATLPAFMCETEIGTVPLAYHEGFHVYQAAHFAETPTEMFTAMAYYPEIDAEFRALCRVEAAVFNDATRPPQEKLPVLAEIIRRRRAHLSGHPSLIAYERFLERSEGTAAFVEQTARLALYGIAPEPVEPDYGWSRFYRAGAALCWLLEATAPGWQTRVEDGESPGDIAIEKFPEPADISGYGWEDALAYERTAVEILRGEIGVTSAQLDAPGALVIYYPAQGQILRAFSPNTLQSLGDGRILHRSMFKLLMPEHGQIGAEGVAVIDDIANLRVILPAREADYDGEELRIHADGIDVTLKHVTRQADGSYRVDAPTA